MTEITEDIYRLVAARLREEIAAAEWFNGTIEGEALLPNTGSETPGPAISSPNSSPTISNQTPGPAISNPNSCASPGNPTLVGWRLTLTAIVYRRTEIYPEGPRHPITDVVPVWWEFATIDADGPILNNFSFAHLKPFLTDPD